MKITNAWVIIITLAAVLGAGSENEKNLPTATPTDNKILILSTV